MILIQLCWQNIAKSKLLSFDICPDNLPNNILPNFTYLKRPKFFIAHKKIKYDQVLGYFFNFVIDW